MRLFSIYKLTITKEAHASAPMLQAERLGVRFVSYTFPGDRETFRSNEKVLEAKALTFINDMNARS